MKLSRIRVLPHLVASCILCSIAVNWIALPNGFAVTGITGLSMTLALFCHVNYAVIYYGLTIIILILTAWFLGARELSNIIVLSILYPMVLWVLSYIQVEIILEEKLLALLLFGAVYGVGGGISYRVGFSYGGSDTLSKILKQKLLKAVSLKHIMLGMDCIVILIMLTKFSVDALAYALVGQIIYVNCSNYIIFNLGPKLYEIQIVCTEPEEIEEFIIHKIQKSTTIYHVIGGYSKEPKIQLDCVCNSREYVMLREFIRDRKQDCFIKVFPLTHVFGSNKDFHQLDDENLV